MCLGCGETPLSEFRLIRNKKYNKSYYQSRCRKCENKAARDWCKEHPEQTKKTRRNGKLKFLYGISQETYDRMFEEQKGLCAACGDPPEEGKVLVVDHDHDTGEVRALLCDGCNIAVGMAKESSERLRKLADYVDKWKPGMRLVSGGTR